MRTCKLAARSRHVQRKQRFRHETDTEQHKVARGILSPNMATVKSPSGVIAAPEKRGWISLTEFDEVICSAHRPRTEHILHVSAEFRITRDYILVGTAQLLQITPPWKAGGIKKRDGSGCDEKKVIAEGSYFALCVFCKGGVGVRFTDSQTISRHRDLVLE